MCMRVYEQEMSMQYNAIQLRYNEETHIVVWIICIIIANQLLFGDQIGVKPTAADQFIVGALIHHHPFSHHCTSTVLNLVSGSRV